MSEQQEGTLRLLTPGEIRLAKTVFDNTIQYHKVWIHHDSYLPFGLQGKNSAMTPNGELYFRKWYTDDFSAAGYSYQQLFIHELSHVWQRERGMKVLIRGLMSFKVSYCYRLDGRLLQHYPMEQQAQIIADHFILKNYGYSVWMTLKRRGDITLEGDITQAVIQQQYQEALRHFPWGYNVSRA